MTDQTTTQAAGPDNSASGDATNVDQTNADQQTAATQVQTTATDATKAQVTETHKAWHEDPAILEYATKRATVDGKVDQKLADKTLARLKRFPSLHDALDWAFNSDKKIADGSYKKPLSDKATPEEVAEYRKINGIPEQPDGYIENLADGLVVGDDDRPAIDFFAKRFHDANLTEAQGKALIKGYYDMVDEQEGLRQQANLAAKEEAETTLKAELGPEYTASLNMINAMVATMPEELQAELYQSTKPDGSQIMNNPAMLKWMAQTAKALNFSGTALPSGQQSAKTLTDEISQIEAAMKDLGSAYYKGPKTPAGETVMRVRYRELLDQQEALASKQRKAG